MGARFSREDELFVRLEHPFYLPGDVVRGHVLLRLKGPIACHHVDVTILGREEVTRHQQIVIGMDTLSRTVSVLVSDAPAAPVHHRQLRLQGMTTLTPGHHAFPFSFALPQALNGTTRLQYKTNVCYVRYRIFATCQMRSSIAHQLTASEKLFVLPRVATFAGVPPAPVSARQSISSLGISRGSVDIQVSIGADDVLIGESIEVRISVTNGTRSPLTALQVRLRQVVSAGPEKMQQLDVSQCDQPIGTAPGESQTFTASLSTASTLPHSMRGRRIACSYSVVCTALAEGGLLGANVSVPCSTKISLHPQPPQDLTARPAPSGFPPLTYSAFAVEAHAAPEAHAPPQYAFDGASFAPPPQSDPPSFAYASTDLPPAYAS